METGNHEWAPKENGAREMTKLYSKIWNMGND